MTPAAAIFIATAYSWGCGAGQATRLESPASPFFTVAVDPTIIPLGTALEITGPFLTRVPARIWRAEDTGPDIVGNRIDVMVSTCEQAEWWGRRQVVVKLRKDLRWQDKLSRPHAMLAERLVSIRGSANLKARQLSVSSAEAQAVRRFRTSLSRDESESVASRASLILADRSSLLEWARQASQ
jgi:3D (Asp-Asp-Asp) domain-containing protein